MRGEPHSLKQREECLGADTDELPDAANKHAAREVVPEQLVGLVAVQPEFSCDYELLDFDIEGQQVVSVVKVRFHEGECETAQHLLTLWHHINLYIGKQVAT
jgi:hypothetical protein